MKIGPIFGILTILRTGSSPFSNGQNESFIEIISIADRMNCTAFVFSPFDIDWSKNALWGYRYCLNTGEWIRQLFPLPDVIYNRIPNRTLENREDIQVELTLLKAKYGSRFFNPCFLDKWNTHAILYSNQKTRDLLPETMIMHNPDIIGEMLSHSKAVYLKPCANSLGNEIVKVTKCFDKYHYIHQNLSHRTEGIVKDCDELVNQLPYYNEHSKYLMQQAIPLAQVDGRPFDLRLLVQKNSRGEWQRTGIAARIAGLESITTHVLYGGSRAPAEKIINVSSCKYRFSSKSVMKQIKAIELSVPQAVENGYAESFGEMEMDLGIDQDGKVWFLEANSKPFRFDERLIRAKSLVRLIRYIRYLESMQLSGNP